VPKSRNVLNLARIVGLDILLGRFGTHVRNVQWGQLQCQMRAQVCGSNPLQNGGILGKDRSALMLKC
jgi:hypothetical protein